MEGWKIEFCTKVNKVEYLALFTLVQNKLVLTRTLFNPNLIQPEPYSTRTLFTFFHSYKH
jgi:hypothetical protein